MSRTYQTLYASPLVTLRDVVCTEACGSGRQEKQCQAASLAFVRSGTFVRRDRMGRHVADATRVVFFDPAEPDVVDHPVPGGDRCTVLIFDDAALREAVRYPRGAPQRHFAHPSLAGTAAMHLAQLPRYRERLTDLALELGFSSHSHFPCAFRSYFGQAPSTLLDCA
jgi:AraC-like DNA-binding protein